MVVKDVVLYPDKPLTQKSEPIHTITPRLAKIASEMFEVLEEQEGVGLAGPQVSIAKRIIVIHEPEKDLRMCLLNPEILEAEGNEMGEEGCLSLPNVYAHVPRATRIRVKALNLNGREMNFEAQDFLARIIQHETDHLNGLIFLDRVDVLTREAKLREWALIREQMSSAASNE